MLYLDITFIIILVVYLYWFTGLLQAFSSEAPYVPMKRAVLEQLVSMVTPQPGDVWIDLGSGDGRVLIAAAKRYQIRGIGIERVSALRLLSRLKILKAGLWKRVKIIRGDFLRTDLSHADIVSVYLLPVTNARLTSKLQYELHPGTQVICYRYPVPGLRYIKTDTEHKLFLAKL